MVKREKGRGCDQPDIYVGASGILPCGLECLEDERDLQFRVRRHCGRVCVAGMSLCCMATSVVA